MVVISPWVFTHFRRSQVHLELIKKSIWEAGDVFGGMSSHFVKCVAKDPSAAVQDSVVLSILLESNKPTRNSLLTGGVFHRASGDVISDLLLIDSTRG